MMMAAAIVRFMPLGPLVVENTRELNLNLLLRKTVVLALRPVKKIKILSLRQTQMIIPANVAGCGFNMLSVYLFSVLRRSANIASA